MGTLQSGDVGITTAKQMVRWKEMFQDTIHFLIGLGYYSDFVCLCLVFWGLHQARTMAVTSLVR